MAENVIKKNFYKLKKISENQIVWGGWVVRVKKQQTKRIMKSKLQRIIDFGT